MARPEPEKLGIAPENLAPLPSGGELPPSPEIQPYQYAASPEVDPDDADGDGRVSSMERAQAGQGGADEMDVDGDGRISTALPRARRIPSLIGRRTFAGGAGDPGQEPRGARAPKVVQRCPRSPPCTPWRGQ